MDKSIIRKIKRLIALAKDEAASDNEVQVALAKAQSLITKHKINEIDLDVTIGDIKSNLIDIYVDYYKPLNHYINYYYFYKLCRTISSYNFCRAIYYTEYTNFKGEVCKQAVIEIIGKDEDFQNVKLLFEYSYKQFLRLSKERYEEAKKVRIPFKRGSLLVVNSYNYIDKTIFLRSYLKGTIEGLDIKLNNNKPTLKEGESYALINTNYNLVIKDYITKYIGKLKDSDIDKSSIIDEEAYKKGIEDSKKENKRIE